MTFGTTIYSSGRSSGSRIDRLERSGLIILVKTQLYPALLATYAVGLASVAARRIQPFARALNEVKVSDAIGSRSAIAYTLAPDHVVESDVIRRVAEFERHHAPASDLLLARLRPALAQFIPEDREYENIFDDVEYLVGLAAMDATTVGVRSAGSVGDGNTLSRRRGTRS
jgi:hypothetical protein